jgi:hypothetical protein
VAIYVWDYVGKMDFLQIFWNAATELRNEASALDEARRFSGFSSEALAESFTKAGFEQVKTASIDIDTHFADFDDYWEPFLGGQGPAPGYVTSLSGTEREALRRLIQKRLSLQNDGSIQLRARALGVKGRMVR